LKDTEELEAHIEQCSRCKTILEEEEKLKKAVASIKLKKAPLSLRMKIESQLSVTDRKNAVFSFLKTSFVAASTALAVVSTFMLLNINKKSVEPAVSSSKVAENIKFHTSQTPSYNIYDYDSEIIPATYTEPVTFASWDESRKKPKTAFNGRIPLKTMENLLVKHYSGAFINKRHRKLSKIRTWMHKKLRKINNLPSFADLKAKFAGAPPKCLCVP
jgi:hypothetical protein